MKYVWMVRQVILPKGYAVGGIVRIVGEASAEGVEQLIVDKSLKLADEAVVEEIVLGLNVEGRIRLTRLRDHEVSWEELYCNP